MLLLGLSSLLSSSPLVAQEKKPTTVVAKGYVACLDEKGHRLSADRDCNLVGNQEAPNYELLTSDSKRYKFAPDDQLVKIFTESRVRAQELQITGLLHNGNRLELTQIQARRDGSLYDIYYYCDVCEITAYAPGPCPCCYAPLEFREVLAPEKKP